jgi:hypothetical protein
MFIRIWQWNRGDIFFPCGRGWRPVEQAAESPFGQKMVRFANAPYESGRHREPGGIEIKTGNLPWAAPVRNRRLKISRRLIQVNPLKVGCNF